MLSFALVSVSSGNSVALCASQAVDATNIVAEAYVVLSSCETKAALTHCCCSGSVLSSTPCSKHRHSTLSACCECDRCCGSSIRGLVILPHQRHSSPTVAAQALCSPQLPVASIDTPLFQPAVDVTDVVAAAYVVLSSCETSATLTHCCCAGSGSLLKATTLQYWCLRLSPKPCTHIAQL